MKRSLFFLAALVLISLSPVTTSGAGDGGWQHSCDDGSCYVSIAFAISRSGDYVLYLDPVQGHCLLQLKGWDGNPAPLYGAALSIDDNFRIDFSTCNNEGCALTDAADISALRDAALKGSAMFIEVSDGTGWYDERISLEGFAEALAALSGE